MACSHWQIQHLQQQCLKRTMIALCPRSARCRTQNRSSSELEHFTEIRELRKSPLFLICHLLLQTQAHPFSLMAISHRDPHNPTDVEVLDLYHALTKTSDLVVSDLPCDLPLSVWSDIFISTPSEWLNCWSHSWPGCVQIRVKWVHALMDEWVVQIYVTLQFIFNWLQLKLPFSKHIILSSWLQCSL